MKRISENKNVSTSNGWSLGKVMSVFFLAVFLLGAGLFFVGCGDKKNPDVTPEPEPEPTALIYTYNDDDSTVIVKADATYKDLEGAVIIPKTVTYEEKTYTVTGIDVKAFYECANITSFRIPNTITAIGQSAFAKCTGLTTVTIPSSVKTIENNSLAGCTTLTSIEISNGVTEIGASAFAGSTAFASIVIPASVNIIGANAFKGCNLLKSIEFKEPTYWMAGGTEIASGNLTKINSANGLYERSANYLKNLYMNVEWRRIQEASYYTNLTFSSYDADTKTISVSLNSSATNVTEIYIPSKVLYANDGENKEVCSVVIADSGFMNCTALTNVTIQAGLTEIGASAFDGCISLTSITIPASVKTIGAGAFANSGLISAIFENISDWQADGDAITISDTDFGANANQLTTDYSSSEWQNVGQAVAQVDKMSDEQEEE